jgi:CrcB protein
VINSKDDNFDMSTPESDERSRSDDEIDTEYENPITSVRSQRGNIEPPLEDMTHYRLLTHYAILVLASMAGCLIRLGLIAMGTYAGASIFPVAWPQGVGCAIMGLALARKNELKFWPPIFTFWTTGVAASITSFSTWVEEGYLAFADFNGYRRSGFYDVSYLSLVKKRS